MLLEYSCFSTRNSIKSDDCQNGNFYTHNANLCIHVRYTLCVSGPHPLGFAAIAPCRTWLEDDSEVSLRLFLALGRHSTEWPLFSSHVLEEAVYFPAYFPYSASIHQDGQSTWWFRKRCYEQCEHFSRL